MLIKEEYVKPSLLDKISYLEEQPLSEATIPVTENSRLGKYVVSLEDINSFCEDSGKDPGYIISQICELNGIPSDSIAFSISEDSIILGESAANLSINLMNYGVPVYASSTAHDELWESIGYELAYNFGIPIDEMTIAGLKKMLGHEDDIKPWEDNKKATQNDLSRLTYYYGNSKGKIITKRYDKLELPHIYDGTDADPVVSGQKLNIHNMGIDKFNRDSYVHKGNFMRMAHKGTAVQRKRKKEQEMEDKAWAQYNREGLRTNANPGAKKKEMEHGFQDMEMRHDIGTVRAAQRAKEEIEDHYNPKEDAKINNTVKQAESSNDKNFIAKVIAKLHDWAKRYSEKYKQTKVSGPKSAIQKVLSYITSAIASLTKRLHNLTTKYKMN